MSCPKLIFVACADDRCAFERRIPYDLRCRTALVSLPSAYPDARVAETESPALNRRDLRRAFEQHWLALIVSETIVNLNRPYFIKALVERPDDPTRTAHGQAFLSVLERSNVSALPEIFLTSRFSYRSFVPCMGLFLRSQLVIGGAG